ncbi:MAG: UvrD-helicase domain-containing protein, partial [Martelella sp.]
MAAMSDDGPVLIFDSGIGGLTVLREARMLMPERRTFTVVGADDQSIYAWRGARPENLVTLG